MRATLAPGGVLIEWWAPGEYPYPTQRPLPSGNPYQLGGEDATRGSAPAEDCSGVGGSEAEWITVRRSPQALESLNICAREVTDATRAQLEALLQSIEFE